MSTQQSIWENPHDAQWDKLSKNNTPFVERITGRRDATVHIRPYDEDERPANAWWTHDGASMHVNATAVINNNYKRVDTINLNSRMYQDQHPLLISSMVHEAGHARFTNHRYYDFEFKNSFEQEFLKMLEEPRCEARILAEHPQYSRYMKAMVSKLVAPDAFLGKGDLDAIAKRDKELASEFSSVSTLILVGGRIVSGSLPDDDEKINDTMKIVARVLGDNYAPLHAVVERHVLSANTPDEMIANVREMMKILDYEKRVEDFQKMMKQIAQACANAGEGNSQGDSEGGSGEDSEGNSQGSSQGNSQGGSGEDSEGDSQGGSGEDSSEDSGEDNSQGGSGEGESGEDSTENKNVRDLSNAVNSLSFRAERFSKGGSFTPAKAKKGMTPQQKREKDEDKQFIKQVSDVPGNISGSSGGNSAGRSDLYGHGRVYEVEPSMQVREYARIVKRQIEKAQFRDIQRTRVKSMVPPGRMRVGEAMKQQIQIQQRREITATPWEQTRRRSVKSPPINLVVLPDFSGTMSAYQQEVGEYAWAFSHAVRTLKGTSCVVAWDSSPMVTMEPRKGYDKVQVADNGGASSGLPMALAYAEKLTRFASADGVNFAVIITDDALPSGDQIMGNLNYLLRQGVKILWITIGNGTSLTRSLPQGVTHVTYKGGQKFADIISKPLLDALSDD